MLLAWQVTHTHTQGTVYTHSPPVTGGHASVQTADKPQRCVCLGHQAVAPPPSIHFRNHHECSLMPLLPALSLPHLTVTTHHTGRARSSHGASSSSGGSSGGRTYAHSTDWAHTHYEHRSGSSGGYTSTLSECVWRLCCVGGHPRLTQQHESIPGGGGTQSMYRSQPVAVEVCAAPRTHCTTQTRTHRTGRWEWYRRAARHGVRSFSHSLHIGLAVIVLGGGLAFEATHSALWSARNKGVSCTSGGRCGWYTPDGHSLTTPWCSSNVCAEIL
jgi:hypothetical protein